MLERVAWALAAALGLALLAMVAGPHRVGDYFTETDFYGAYAQGARLIQHGHLVPSRYGVVGPVYEGMLALAGFVVRDLFLAAELLAVVGSVVSLVLWFRLLERRVDARAGLCAALFLATNATFFRYGYAATTDAPAIALQSATLYVLLCGTGPRAALGAGVLAALAFLTRYNAIALVPAGLLAVLGGGTPQPRRARAALLFAAGFLAPVAPWVAYSLTHGAGFSFQLHHNIAYEVFAHARGITWDEYQQTLQPQFHSLWDVIARDPAAVAARMVFNVGDHLRQDAVRLLGVPLTVAALAGIGFGIADGTARRVWPVWVAGALLFATLVPAFYAERYSLALLPMWAALASLAFASPRLALMAGRVWLKPALALVVAGFALVHSVAVQRRAIDQLPVEVLQAARALRPLVRPGDRIIARKPNVAWHAGIESVPFPFVRTLDGLAAAARARGARWLYMSWPEAETRQDFWYLLDTTGVVPGLTVRAVTAPHVAVVYEIGPDFGRAPDWYGDSRLRTLHIARGRLSVDARQPEVLRGLADAQLALGRPDSARAALERAAEIAPRSLALQLQLGDLLLTMGDAAGGRLAYERAEALDPTSVDARVGRGWASLVAHDVQGAAGLWRPVVESTRDPATLERMVQVYQAVGDPEAAAAAQAALARLQGAR